MVGLGELVAEAHLGRHHEDLARDERVDVLARAVVGHLGELGVEVEACVEVYFGGIVAHAYGGGVFVVLIGSILRIVQVAHIVEHLVLGGEGADDGVSIGVAIGGVSGEEAGIGLVGEGVEVEAGAVGVGVLVRILVAEFAEPPVAEGLYIAQTGAVAVVLAGRSAVLVEEARCLARGGVVVDVGDGEGVGLAL